MRRFAIILAATCLCSAPSHADWPDWRGPTADGHSDATGLPLHWSETENIAWKTAIHDNGHSTPVVLDDQIWLTTAKEDGTVLYAVCVDLDSGAVLHDITVFEVAEPQRIHPLNTYATPSAAIEQGRVYVHYGSLGTACIDTQSGEVLWRRSDLNTDHMQGPVSSPVLFENMVIITVEGVDSQFIAALDKKTGETLWLYKRPEELYTGIQGVYLKSYQTPVILEIGGQPQLVSNGALLVTGHNLQNGEEIWRARYKDDSTISRIVRGNGLLFVNTGGPPGGTELWAIREGGHGDVTDSHVVWKMTEDAPHESSPVLVGDLLFCISDPGVLKCLEAATGTMVWSKPMESKYGASLLSVAGRIYLSNKKGKTTVIAPEREYKELATSQLDGELWTSPAVAGDSLLLRTKTHLYRIAESK